MDLLFEILIELILEGSLELSKSRKVPIWIRIPLIILIILFFLFAISMVFLAGFLLYKENKIVSIFMLLIGVFLVIMSIKK